MNATDPTDIPWSSIREGDVLSWWDESTWYVLSIEKKHDFGVNRTYVHYIDIDLEQVKTLWAYDSEQYPMRFLFRLSDKDHDTLG